jgi:Helix-turn-helix domain
MNATISFDGLDEHMRQIVREEIANAQLGGNGGYLSTKGAARYLDCTEEAINARVKRRELKPAKRNPRLFSRESLDEWVRNGDVV